MMRSHLSSSVDRRIAHAVMLVLAGCQKAPDAQSSDSLVTTTTGTGSLATATAPPEDPTVEGDPSPTQVPNVAVGAEAKPMEFCAQYKETVKVDVTRVKHTQTAEYAPMIQESAYWDAQRKLVSCTIIRAKEDTNIEVTRVPTCCPMPGPSQPCPPPYKEKAPGLRMVVEQVELHPDGKVASSKLAAHGFEKNPRGRHNCGRQPEGLALSTNRLSANWSVGEELASMAELEAASVPAFERLARELHEHGAPVPLVERARAAARDEVCHARAMRRLAAQHGATVSVPSHAELGVRELLPIAIENAVEGCVREAYGALVASYQAQRAAPSLRGTFRGVAKDERAHAALAEDVDHWLSGHLDERGRAQVAAARAAAVAELRGSLEAAKGCETLGLPNRQAAIALFEAYFLAA